jgi:hypothetical protein
VDARGRVRDPPLHRLPVRERHAEGHALLGVGAQHLQRPPRDADAARAHLQAADVEAELHGRVALAHLAQHLAPRHAAVLEHQLVGAAPADHGDLALDEEAGRAALHDEGGHALRPLALARARHDDEEVRRRHAADPDLAPVDPPAAVAVRHARVIIPAGSPPAPGSEIAMAERASPSA